MKARAALLGLLLPVLAAGSGEGRGAEPADATPAVVVAGARSSKYGIRPFPSPEEWVRTLRHIGGRFRGSTATAIWIVGALHERDSCMLEFPAPEVGTSLPYVVFQEDDKHEPFLSAFDAAGIEVFLQVEPGLADPGALIDLVLERYGHHPCVVGFGVDAEWYRESEYPEWGKKIDDATARAWEARAKAHDAGYRLFLKHWDRGWMPPVYRGEIVFVDDSQQLPDLQAMADEFAVWGETFAPNPVYFQVGYRADEPWWGTLADPLVDVGRSICRRIPQDCGIFWVDFTLRDTMPDDVLDAGVDDRESD